MLTRIRIKVLLVTLLLIGTIVLDVWVIMKEYYAWLVLLIPFTIYQIYLLYKSQHRLYMEFENFVLAIRYKDFSRRFDVKHAPAEVKLLRDGFNEISDSFRMMSKEKEMHYQYLQKILEMVETGILSYEEETNDVVWMNDSLKQTLHLPYLKNVESLARRDKSLRDNILNLKPGESRINTTLVNKETFKLLLNATAFQTAEKKYKLVTFQNISEAVDETESEAWKKLLSVMTHEIMNSVAPISSLAATLQRRLSEENKDSLALHDDIEIGIGTIKKRSESLLKFAEIYRNLNKISQPDRKLFFVRDLFENIYNLMEPTLQAKNIELEIVLKETGLQLNADITLLEQVLINLVVNAIEAVKDVADKRIILSAEINNHKKIAIRVSDNGSGMEPEILEKIFIPFFSTRKNGSGIGLSLSRQIMRLHNGSLQVVSEPGKGTVFTMQF